MKTTSHDYLRIVDLNPTINGAAAPVNAPVDPRALHMFGFSSAGQRIENRGTYPVFYSFDYDYLQGGTIMPPAGLTVKVHGVLQPGEMRYTEHHDRAHVLVWLDQTAAPPQGVAVEVHVQAWAK